MCEEICVFCGHDTGSESIFRLFEADQIVICEICLSTMVAFTDPESFRYFYREEHIIYEDLDKEAAYFGLSPKIMEKIRDKSNEVKMDMPTLSMPDKKQKQKQLPAPIQLPTPQSVMDYLNQYVIGQDQPKKVLSVAAYNHQKRLHLIDTGREPIKKNNILLLGPTGSGKTYMVNLISKMLDVPYVCYDANTLTQAGYVGNSVEDILSSLFEAAGRNQEKAQRGIVLIDEIDKLGGTPGTGRDVSGRGVQESLLKIIEGGVFQISLGNGPGSKTINFDTSETLFICAGAFAGLEKKLASKGTSTRDFIGGSSKERISATEAYRRVTVEDIVDFGLIPELVGRLSVRSVLSELTTDDLVEIMTNTKDSVLEQYKRSLAFDNVNLKVTKPVLKKIAAIAKDNGTGARGLNGIFEELLLDIQFEAPSGAKAQNFSITSKMVDNIGGL